MNMASGGGASLPQRFSARRKLQAVQRLMGGESLEAQPRDQRDDEIARLQSKVGEITMDKELLEEKVRRLEGRPSPSRRRRSRK